MTSEAFIIGIQEYYGMVYTKPQTKYIKDWLDAPTKSDRWRACLFDVCLLKYTGITPKGEKYLPNIAVFEGYGPMVRERLQ
jgi:hypothetical protein